MPLLHCGYGLEASPVNVFTQTHPGKKGEEMKGVGKRVLRVVWVKKEKKEQ